MVQGLLLGASGFIAFNTAHEEPNPRPPEALN